MAGVAGVTGSMGLPLASVFGSTGRRASVRSLTLAFTVSVPFSAFSRSDSAIGLAFSRSSSALGLAFLASSSAFSLKRSSAPMRGTSR